MRRVERANATPDPNQVNLGTSTEIRYWTNRFSVSEERLRNALEKVGSDIDEVAAFLNR